ncbi:MAG TPA: HIT family protein [Sphingobium sp.]|uniref:HIT family protein n=1 Tax=unclassified Sphingobium TaxID=2611147 RepID=UPI000EB81DF1|nr:MULTISPECIES: HIT family protein [unclassified Sphingobium]WIW88702.1 HIT family protein [Sphingobium sp. V4]HAF40997.1 HIT family protein [Sphingobium sp.]
MSLDGTYDESNVFALILAGKIPATALYQDETTFAFLDIMPQTRGHALVISKWSKARNLLEIEEEALAQVMATTKKVATAIRRALNPDGIQIAQFNGAPAGQTIFHLHVHILPRWEGDPRGFAAHGHGKQADMTALQALADEIRAQF